MLHLPSPTLAAGESNPPLGRVVVGGGSGLKVTAHAITSAEWLKTMKAGDSVAP